MTTDQDFLPRAPTKIEQASLPTGLRAIPGSIWTLGFVSMFADISSEMIHSLLPVFLVSVLGASTIVVGLIEGIAEAIALITKVFSGPLSDYLGRRKFLTTLGYGLAAFTKPLFPLAHSVAWVVTARFIDRIGKGIRGAPRDALVGDIAPLHLRGACYGLRQSLDTVGAFAGPLMATIFMALTLNSFRTVFWIAVVPAFLALALMIFVKEPETVRLAGKPQSPIRATDFWQLGAAYWSLVLIAAVLTLARFSEAFLVLRAQNIGLPVALVPLVMVVMNVAYAVSAYPAGHLSDRMDRRLVLAAGFVVLIGSDIVLALATGVWQLMAGVTLWGLHMGLTQGLLAALVADTTPSLLRGTAFGVFNFTSGVAMLIASFLAGWLWDQYGPQATFYAGAGFTTVALFALMIRRPAWYFFFLLVCAGVVMAASPPLFLPDGSLKPGAKVTIPAGQEREFLFQREGARFLSGRAHIKSVGAPLIDPEGQEITEFVIDTDKFPGVAWIHHDKPFRLRIRAETDFTLEARESWEWNPEKDLEKRNSL